MNDVSEKIKVIYKLERLIRSKYKRDKKKYKYKNISNSFALINDALAVVKNNLTKLMKDSKFRSQLIDLQILEEIFEGDLHNNYHKILEEIETDLNNLFSSIKALINRIPDLIAEVLPHEQKRKVKTGSYGKFLNSLQKLLSENSLPQAFKKISDMAQQIKVEHNDYRDKFIEHAKPSDYHSFLKSYGNMSVLRAHIKQQEKTGERIKTLGGKPHWTKFSLSDNKYYYYIHISLNSKIKKGYKFTKGEVLGELYDSDTGHFKKFGDHYHIFASPNLDIDKLNYKDESTKIELSPEPITVTSKVLDLIIESCNMILNVGN